jgi:CHASE2 domain-containing sensor protein/signal transduction histidine kinase
MNLRLRLTIEWLLIGIFGTILVLAAQRWEGTVSFDNLFYDQLSAAFRPAADESILLVNIDDPSLAALGRWPWPRSTHTNLIQKLQAANPRTITVDIILSESGDAENDAALAKAMQGPAPVYIPLHFSTPGSNGNAYDVIPPAAPLASAASGIGHVDVVSDSDGTVRRARLCADPNENQNRWPHLMELAYRGKAGAPSAAYRKVACEETMLIPFTRRGNYSEISYSDILTGEVPADLIKGRNIIIGASAVGMGDNYPVPYADGGILAGSEIMANILAAIKRNNFVAQAPYATVILFSLLPMWLLLICFIRLSPRIALFTSLAIVASILILSAASLSIRYWIPPGSALLGILLVYPLWGWRRLQAMSDFMGRELKDLERENNALPIQIAKTAGTDLVGRQSAALANAIDHLRDLRLFVANALADLPDPMVVTDRLGNVTLVNDLADQRLQQNVIGYRLNDVMNQVAIPEHRKSVSEYVTRHDVAVSTGEDAPATKSFVRFHTVEGDTFVMRQSPIETSDGSLLGFVYYLADITALARAEVEREQVLQLLSHDMRAPQSAIIASLSGTMDADARKRIETNARRTMKLAQDFVDIARMAETEFIGEDILLIDLLRDVADNFWPLASERGLKFEFDDNSDSAFISGEQDSLNRAFSNLFDNAIKYSPANTIIQIGAAKTLVDNNPHVRVTIRDSGPGIAPEILPRLFQRFASTAEIRGNTKGVGLGLTFVLAVIQRHGGTITAENLDIGGSCFTILLRESVEIDETV